MSRSSASPASPTASLTEPASFGAGDTAGSGKLGMWIFLVTDGMGFGGLLLAYGVLRARAASWPDAGHRLAIPLAAAMTLALVTSSLTVLLALAAARAGRRAATGAWLAITLACGALFLVGQACEYHHLLTATPATRLTSDTFASTFYAITGYHGLHVAAGLALLSALLLRNFSKAPPNSNLIEVVALFWHFVDLAWVPIFTFVYLLPVR